MGKYSVGYHGPKIGRDLQGIATLTHDPVAIDNLRHEQNSQADNELDKVWSGAAADIEKVKQVILEATGIPKEAFEN